MQIDEVQFYDVGADENDKRVIQKMAGEFLKVICETVPIWAKQEGIRLGEITPIVVSSMLGAMSLLDRVHETTMIGSLKISLELSDKRKLDA